MMGIEEVEKEIISGKKLEDVIKKFGWKFFENFVKEVLEIHSFTSFNNFRFKTVRRFEIDVLAVKGDLVLGIDCKMLSRGRYKKSEIRRAALLQEERLRELKKVSASFNLSGKKFYSVLITLLEEEIVKEGNTLVIPVWKLNNFLCNLEYYLSFSKNL